MFSKSQLRSCKKKKGLPVVSSLMLIACLHVEMINAEFVPLLTHCDLAYRSRSEAWAYLPWWVWDMGVRYALGSVWLRVPSGQVVLSRSVLTGEWSCSFSADSLLDCPFIGWFLRRLNFAAWVRILASFQSSIDWNLLTSSTFWIWVDLLAPVMRRSAGFWTLLFWSNFDFEAVAHAEIPYYATCLSLPVYIFFRMRWSATPASVFIITSLNLARLQHLMICCFHVSLPSVTPR